MPDFPKPEALLRKFGSKALSGAEIYFTCASTLSLEYSGKSYKAKEFSEDAGYGVRILKNKKIGFSHTNIPGDFRKAAKTAEKLSGISPKTSFCFEPQHKKYPKQKMEDPKLKGLPPEIAFSAVQEILEAIRRHAEPTRISISLSEGSESIANTSGLFAEAGCTEIGIYAEAKKGRGLGYSVYSSRFLPKSFSGFGTEAGKIASAMAESKSIPSQKLTVKFSQDMLSSLLSFLMFSFDGDNKRRGITRLRKGQKKFSSAFTLFSDPLALADSSCPFDGEGVPSSRLSLVNEGKVENFLYDRHTAALEGTEGKGSCQRTDYASSPSPGITNLVVAPGTYSGKGPSRFLEVISFHGLHTSDPVSGDFGVSVDIGFLHGKGKKIPVTDVLLTGNIFNLFNSIKHLGKGRAVHGNLVSPEIWFSDVQIVGK
jgi:PmbA protein